MPLVGSEPAPTPGNLMDLMSYCGVFGDATFPWLSARNWNHTFRTLQDWAGRLTAPARAARLAAASSSPDPVALGVIGPSGGRIDRLTVPAAPAPLSVPSSPIRLRAFDAAGTLLRDAGVEIAA